MPVQRAENGYKEGFRVYLCDNLGIFIASMVIVNESSCTRNTKHNESCMFWIFDRVCLAILWGFWHSEPAPGSLTPSRMKYVGLECSGGVHIYILTFQSIKSYGCLLWYCADIASHSLNGRFRPQINDTEMK